MPQPVLFRIIDRAVHDYALIENGDRILVGASGGKDSTALVQYLAYRARQGREQFEFCAVHVATEIGSPFSPQLRTLFETWGVVPQIIEVSVLGRLKEGKKMNCWWCATQRRTELVTYAREHGFNKIALGHHMDDILETLLMNALQKGELSTMPPRLQYEKYPVTIIRPLCFADVGAIVEHGKKNQYYSATCTCDYQENSGRKEARTRLSTLVKTPAEKRRLLQSLQNVRLQYLMYPPGELPV